VPGDSQDGRASLNFPLPRSHTANLWSTMKMYSRHPLTIARNPHIVTIRGLALRVARTAA
jgi:hypothetical protein